MHYAKKYIMTYFCSAMIDAYLDMKMQDVMSFEHTPHPVEYVMCYSHCDRSQNAKKAPVTGPFL
jgi:glutamine synthetase